MSGAFFPEEPDEQPAGEGAEPPRDPRREPPRDEIGAQVVIGELVAATDRVAVLLSSVIVHSDGALFVVERTLRRAGADAEEWRRAFEDFNGHFVPGPSKNQLRWGMVLGTGERVISDRFFFGDPDQPHEGHLLGQHSGGGSGNSEWAVQTDRLWLHPLPPDGPLEVVFHWPAMGIPESRIVIDGTAIAVAAAKVRPLWTTPEG